MATELTLEYFEGIRGLAEPMRMLLELAGKKWTFKPVVFAEWKDAKKAIVATYTPYAQVPVLEDPEAGITIGQSRAILNHLARRFGYAGTTTAESARVEEVNESAIELRDIIFKGLWDDAFAEKRDKEMRTAYTDKLKQFEAYITRIKLPCSPYLVGRSLTIADIQTALALEAGAALYPDVLTEATHPTLAAFYSYFFNRGPAKEYVRSEKRPRCTMPVFAKFGGKPEETVNWA